MTPPDSYPATAHNDKATHRKLTLWLLNHDAHWQQGGYISTVTEDAHLDPFGERGPGGVAGVVGAEATPNTGEIPPSSE